MAGQNLNQSAKTINKFKIQNLKVKNASQNSKVKQKNF